MKRSPGCFGKKCSSHGLISEILYLVMFIPLIVLLCGTVEHVAYAETDAGNASSKVLVQDGDEWHYFTGDQEPPPRWNQSSFDHSNWRKGPTGIGYGTGGNRTYLGDMKGNYTTVYARSEFSVSDPGAISGMTLSTICDGPFIAYLNGIEILRTNTLQSSTPGQTISTDQAEKFNISGFVHELFPFENNLSIRCSNDDINSDDFSLIPVLEVFGNDEVQQ